ncbi:hypothetical protein O5D80_005891 [Batrachochytrium dendrobatidis]|nr:hypothetical protein O5D80_005891 [Batrachochytrium dendrobatidis]
MEPAVQYYHKPDYIETDTGNKVSRKAHIYGIQNIVLGGKTIIQDNAVLRGDLRRAGAGHSVAITTGRLCQIHSNVIIRPPYKLYKGSFSYYPMKMGDHVIIEHGSIIEASSIGSYIHIGKDCVIGRFVVIKDCTRILDGAVVPANTVIPPFSVFGGNPGLYHFDVYFSTFMLY